MSGLKTLYNLLLKDTIKGSGQASGIMSIGDSVRKLAKRKFEAYVATAQRQGVDLDKLSEEQIKYMLELNKPKAPKVYSNEEAYEILSRFANQNKTGKVIKADFGKPFKEEIGSVDNIINDITRMEPIAAMKEVNKVLGKKGKYKNLSKQDSEKIFKDTDDWINQRDPADLYDYKNKRPFREDPNFDPDDPDFNPEDMAQGGRAGFKMGRRAFLKLMGGAAAGIGALKAGALKMFGKEGAKKVATDVVTTPPVAGKPAWFDSLVNKVIREGDDVSKNFATKEREIVHIKKIDEDSTVTVTQDLDEGIVRVEYDSADNVFGDTVQLQYKKPLPDEVNPNPQAEFTTAESGPVGRQVGPDDYDIDVDEVGGTSIKDLDSDVSKLKEYATGQKPTLKEIVQNKKRKDKAQRITDDPEEQSDAVVRRQGEMLDYDGPDDDFASGGRVGLLSGGGVIRVMLKKLAERYGKKPSELLAVTNYKSLPVEVRKFLTKEQFDLIKKDMQASRVEQFENLRDMVKSRQEFDRSAEALKKMGMDISDTTLPLMKKAVTPGGTTADDLLMMEQVIKNLRMKDRKLNAAGGLAGMLGE